MGAYFRPPPPALSGAKVGHLSLVWKIIRLRKKVGHLKVPGGGLKYAPTVIVLGAELGENHLKFRFLSPRDCGGKHILASGVEKAQFS